jgi:predicted dinucleotide-binding enzyme
MTHVTIIGSGNMGQAISGLVSKGGNTVELLRHSDTGKPVTGDIVVLAVPHAAIPDILATRGDQLVGKVVVDITNPLNFQTFDSLTVPADSSAAAQIAASLPQSRVVKAFNTNLAATLASGTADPHTITAASPLPDELRQAIKAISTSQPAHQN